MCRKFWKNTENGIVLYYSNEHAELWKMVCIQVAAKWLIYERLKKASPSIVSNSVHGMENITLEFVYSLLKMEHNIRKKLGKINLENVWLRIISARLDTFS